jgi:hypothetical protein
MLLLAGFFGFVAPAAVDRLSWATGPPVGGSRKSNFGNPRAGSNFRLDPAFMKAPCAAAAELKPINT